MKHKLSTTWSNMQMHRSHSHKFERHPKASNSNQKWEEHSNEDKTRSTSCKTESPEPEHVSHQRGCFCHGVFVFCVLFSWRQGRYRIDVRNMYLIEFAFSLQFGLGRGCGNRIQKTSSQSSLHLFLNWGVLQPPHSQSAEIQSFQSGGWSVKTEHDMHCCWSVKTEHDMHCCWFSEN